MVAAFAPTNVTAEDESVKMRHDQFIESAPGHIVALNVSKVSIEE